MTALDVTFAVEVEWGRPHPLPCLRGCDNPTVEQFFNCRFFAVSPDDADPTCEAETHGTPHLRASSAALDRAARLFRALGDEARLRTLELLLQREACVSELAEATGESLSTVSHRLRLLRSEDLVMRRREGRHVFYALADAHVIEMIRNALDHATEHSSQKRHP